MNTHYTKFFLLVIAVLLINGCDTFTDSRDGKVYKKVRIGSQVWMADNLAFRPTRGEYLPASDFEDYINDYGYLYEWNTACRVCPSGWHLPTIEEWQILIEELGGTSVAGGRLKEPGLDHWDNPNGGSGYDSGFLGLPGSAGVEQITLHEVGVVGHYWSSTGVRAKRLSAQHITLNYATGEVNTMTNPTLVKLSVRCVKN